MRRRTESERFWAKVWKIPGGCWIWTGHLDRYGRGRFHLRSGMVLTHRWAYEALVGPIPEHLELSPLCHTRACCNPEHLKPVTRKENPRRKVRTASERFWEKVDSSQLGPGGCWLWTASDNGRGYGRFSDGIRHVQAHRWAWEEAYGPIPEELEMDHAVCSTTLCVNPAHLEPVTHLVNARRGRAGQPQLAKTHCPKGHEYSVENTRINPRGSRVCRKCVRLKNRAYWRNSPEYRDRSNERRRVLVKSRRTQRFQNEPPLEGQTGWDVIAQDTDGGSA